MSDLLVPETEKLRESEEERREKVRAAVEEALKQRESIEDKQLPLEYTGAAVRSQEKIVSKDRDEELREESLIEQQEKMEKLAKIAR